MFESNMGTIMSAVIGGLVGMVGVAIALYYNYKTKLNTQKFQRELNEEQHLFQKELLSLSLNQHKNTGSNINERSFKAEMIWQNKYNTFIQLMSYRHELESKEFKAALNSITGSFCESKIILDNTNKLHASLADVSALEGRAKDDLITLLKSMMTDLGLETKNNDMIFTNIFAIPDAPTVVHVNILNQKDA
ncbi:hypothetical protein [Vagococcus fessus]|uniref:Uncharacterized protein n=1 Tax=Vagococcus fessus TaxID=120370 RepID=A0A430AC02_9ENTE|nr:hypothetical protein [Vagococcus fessus]RSU04756.1 hypothetical protein CBF31_01680 [Vagococcus fessus]